ncbi:SagB/ThcOx family dehydrogenase [Alkalicoccobacillus murimartini]|uniref:SagB-type dehydrogenase family enzyme n=1 Tax=Alkalicoccobacillus murimartini TaxID=171685 RepID=A0ABT9YDV3_9BACI|nr:SagB/ThcOx family dehydrogenase [Alkalicoccobacillus murimartini]MDQ0205377.1 SagB-type dehydrogenase family enzyme [Alkalicoccobacillus murimartini]
MTTYFTTYHKESNWPPMKKPINSLHDQENVHYPNSLDLNYKQVELDLMGALKRRESAKDMQIGESMDRLKLGTLLKWSIGDMDGKRMFPSAGHLYTITCLVVVKQLNGVKPGIYEYTPATHSLGWLCAYQEIDNAFVQDGIDFNVCLVLGTDFKNVSKHYGERGYRFSLLEAGHMMQNVQLVAASINVRVTPIGGFKDKIANEFIPLMDFKTIYLVPVGE